MAVAPTITNMGTGYPPTLYGTSYDSSKHPTWQSGKSAAATGTGTGSALQDSDI